MVRRIDDFLGDWQDESEGTLKLLRVLSDTSLSQAVGPEDRTLGRIAWHVTTSIPEMMERTGLRLGGPPADRPVPATVSELVDTYERLSQGLARQIRESWTDETLEREDEMYGEQWARGLTLQILIKHQAHHRGQMTVLMRQAGLKVPGVYGPSREEWSQFGGAAPEI